MSITREQADKLKAPFNPEDISWKPQTVDYKNNTALAVAYCDPRGYVDRLNEVFGVGGWSDSYTFIATPFNKFIKGKAAYKEKPATEDKQVPGNKVLCVCMLVVHPDSEKHNTGATVSSTGDSDASDENAATSAEAQAFKRAAMKLGLGRYLYDLPKVTAAYSYGKWTNGTPTLPDWAMPKYQCDECKSSVKPATHNEQTFSVAQLLANSQRKYQKDLCADCQRKKVAAEKSQLVRTGAQT
jgi:hypothetical protein